MGKSSPPPPPAPDYAGAATAQGAANLEAAQASSRLNNPNVINPYGTQTWMEGAGGSDRPTVTQTLSPEQQALLTQQNETKGLLGGLATQGATALQGVVGKPVDFSGAPAAPGSADATRMKVMNAMMGRVNEDYDKQTDQSNSDLVAAGISPGTKAYGDRMQMIERARTDARGQAELAGGNAAAQSFSMDTQRRKDAMAEMLAQRGIPLNEITALMSGSQTSNPFAAPGVAQNAQAAPSPMYAAANAAGQYGTDVYNAQVGQQNAMMGGLFGLGSAGVAAAPALLAMSDRRLKSRIRRIGTHPLGIGLYRYLIFGRSEVGVMADEVLKVKPEAVHRHLSGYLMVNYGALDA